MDRYPDELYTYKDQRKERINDRNPCECVFLYICTLNVGVYTREYYDVATRQYSDNRYYLIAIPPYCPN